MPPSARRVELEVRRERIVRALLRADVQGTQNGGYVVSLRQGFERSIFVQSAAQPEQLLSGNDMNDDKPTE